MQATDVYITDKDEINFDKSENSRLYNKHNFGNKPHTHYQQ